MGELKSGAALASEIFYIGESVALSFGDVEALSHECESALGDLPPRSLVVLQGFSPSRLWALILAAFRRDLAVLPLLAESAIPEVPWSLILRDGGERIQRERRAAEYRHDADLYILTSGSTGLPKAIGHSLGGLLASARSTLDFYGFRSGQSWLLSLDPAHIGGFQILLRMWSAGGRVIYGGQPKDVAKALLDSRPDFLSLVPTQLFAMLDMPELKAALSSCKAIMLGGAATQASLLERLRPLALPISITYGSSETASQITGFPAGQFPADARNVGRVLPHWTLKDVSGEVAIDGRSLFLGYFQDGIWHKRPDPFLLPDRAQVVGGELILEGRRDQVFQVGGENVSPAEILAVLESDFSLGHLLILKRPDERLGLVPLLVVRSSEEPDLARILAKLQELKPMLRPREVLWLKSDQLSKLSQAGVEALLRARDPALIRLWTYDSL